MSPRKRVFIYLVVAGAVFGLGYLGYTQFYKPIKEQNDLLAQLDDQLSDKRIQLLTDLRDNQRIATVLPRSLPADRELAEAEYKNLLERLFKAAKLPPKYSLQTQSDTDPAPDLNAAPTGGGAGAGGLPPLGSAPPAPGPIGGAKAAAKPAYTKLTYTLTLEKVGLPKVVEFLTLYHKEPLLHQIVKFTIKHTTTGPMGVKLEESKRNDLTVTLVTEAVILDGAPARKTLYDVPDTFTAALGGPLVHALRNDREKARNLTPVPDPAFWALATEPREYALLAARDVFHGPLPEYKSPPPPQPQPVKPIETPPTPPDNTPFVYLSALVRTNNPKERTAQADIVDRFYGMVYTLTFSQSGERMSVDVQRYTRDTKTNTKTGEVEAILDRDRLHPRGGLLEFSDRLGKNTRTFKVYGLNGNSLLLGEMEKPPEEKEKEKGKWKGAKAPPPKAVDMNLPLAGIGGLVAVKLPAKPSVEKFYRWEVGKAFKELKPLTEGEAKEAKEEAAYGLLDVPVRERAPAPRPVKS